MQAADSIASSLVNCNQEYIIHKDKIQRLKFLSMYIMCSACALERAQLQNQVIFQQILFDKKR